MTKISPLPEFLKEQGRDWIVSEHEQPYIDVTHKVLFAPLDESSLSHSCRIHQVATIKWEPVRPNGLLDRELALWECLSHFRTNMILRDHELDMSYGPMHHHKGKGGLCEPLLNHDTKAIHVGKIEQILGKDLYSEKAFQEAFVFLKKLPDTAFSSRRVSNGKALRGEEDKKSKAQRDQGDVEESELMEHDAQFSQLPKEMKKLAGACPERSPGFGPWGTMNILRPLLKERITGRLAKQWKKTEEGVLPRYLYRYTMDRQIFGYKRYIPGGTVLIDGSGSMHISPDQIDRTVNFAPGATIGLYFGYGGAKGALKILATKGRRADAADCKADGGANIVDYPALQWLSKLPHPRIWISDGYVTGQNEFLGVENYKQCMSLCRKKKIVRLQNIESSIEFLRKAARIVGYVPERSK